MNTSCFVEEYSTFLLNNTILKIRGTLKYSMLLVDWLTYTRKKKNRFLIILTQYRFLIILTKPTITVNSQTIQDSL